MCFRITNGVLKFIPNKQFELYLKTHKYVSNIIHNNMSTAKEWAKWCINRYQCNNTNIISEIVTEK